MSLRHRLSHIARSWRAPRRSALASAASLARLETLAAAQRFEDLRRRCSADNPLLVYGAKHWSQNDEDGLIEEIVHRARGDTPGTFLELGVGDGVENNTLNLLAQGWRGVWLGGEPLAFASDGTRLAFRQCWIDRDNVARVAREALAAHGIGQPDLVSLDLDGNDHHLCRQLVDAGIAPAVWVVEYNARFSPHARWVMRYDANHRWDGSDHFGASLAAFHELLAGAGYRLVACNITGANAFFVRAELSARFPEVPDDWRRLYMPAEYLPYPSFAHRASLRTIESLIA